MAKPAFPEQWSVYKSATRIFVDSGPVPYPEAGTLTAIGSKVRPSHKLVLAARFQEAVTTHQEAMSLTCAHLKPTFL